MFKRVGREIKTWAKVLVILEMIPVVMSGVGLAIAAAVYDDDMLILGIICGIVVILLGYFFVRLANIMLYAKGELVDRVARIDEKLEKMEKMQQSAPPAPMPAPMPAPAPYAPPSYGFAPPAPVVSAPIQTPQVVKPVQSTPVMSAPVQSAPVVSAPIVNAPVADDPILEDDYTYAAVPTPKTAAPADWTCPNCGQVNSADGNWCRNCGTRKNG